MSDVMIIPLAGIALPIVLVPTIATMKLRYKKREWEHLERMHSIQMGLTAPAASRPWGGSVTAIGAGVPAASVLAALVTTLTFQHSDPETMAMVLGISWGCSSLVSMTAMIAALVLGLFQIRAANAADERLASASLKPSYDPDAFDVVSSRG